MIRILLVLLLLASPCFGVTLAELEADLRELTAEQDTSLAYMDSAAARSFLNSSQYVIATLAGLIEKSVSFEYTGDSTQFDMPWDFQRVKGALIKVAGKWQLFPQNPMLSIDTTIMTWTIEWDPDDTAQLIIGTGGFEQTYQDIVYESDKYRYELDSNFRSLDAVLAGTENGWSYVGNNPSFAIDTSLTNISIHWHGTDTAYMYVQIGQLVADDTLRVFYRRSLKSGDSLRVFYYGVPDTLGVPTDVCQLKDNLHPFIVREAFGYYLSSLRMFGEAHAIWALVRQDLGVAKQ